METDPNRQWNGKEKEDGSDKDLCGVFHALNLSATRRNACGVWAIIPTIPNGTAGNHFRAMHLTQAAMGYCLGEHTFRFNRRTLASRARYSCGRCNKPSISARFL